MSTQLIEPDNNFSQLTSVDYLGYSPNVYYSSQYLYYGDRDYSYFYAPAGQTISIDTYGWGSYSDDVDTTVTLYRGYNGPQVAFDDDGGYGLNSSLDYYVSTGGYYYVAVAGYNNGTGYYDLSVNVG